LRLRTSLTAVGCPYPKLSEGFFISSTIPTQQDGLTTDRRAAS